jgi:hypothetical protein
LTQGLFFALFFLCPLNRLKEGYLYLMPKTTF